METNFEMALRASHAETLVTFGQFNVSDMAGETVAVAFNASRYAYVGSPLALALLTVEGNEHYTVLTVNIRPNDCKSDEIIVKMYSENEHLRAPLLTLGLFEDTGKRIESGFVQCEIWRLTEKFASAFDAAYQEAEATQAAV
jgi:hypothetical protein